MQKLTFVQYLVLLSVLCGTLATAQERVFFDGFEAPGSTLNCSTISASPGSAQPFDKIALLDAGGVNEASFYVHVDGLDGTETIAPVFAEGASGFSFVTPIHPGGLLEGGSAVLTVTDGQESCAGINFIIEPLPVPADEGLLGDFWAALVDSANQRYAEAGTDAPALAATALNDLPAEWVPLALLEEFIANFDPEAEYAAMDQTSRDLLNALISKLGILEQLSASLATLPSGMHTKAAKSPRAHAAEVTTGGDSAAPQAAESGDCTTLPGGQGDYALDTPEQLAALMQQALDDKAQLENTRDFASGTKKTLSALSAVTTDPRAKLVIGLTNTIITGIHLNAIASGYDKPDQLSRLNFALENSRIEEDWDTTQDGEIRWHSARLWATSSGLRYNGPTGDGQEAQDGFESQLPPPELSPAEQAVQSRMDQLDPAAGQVNCFQILPVEYGPVNIPDGSGEQWVTATVLGEQVVSLSPSDQRLIEPQRIGTGTLRVSSTSGAFPGIIVFSDSPVSILQKLVQWITPPLFIDAPGAPYQASFQIANSRHAEKEDLVVEPGEGVIIDEINGSAGNFDVLFTTPADIGKYPNSIEVTSTSKQLPPAEPPRSDTLQLLLESTVSIDDLGTVCIAGGEPLDLTATYNGPLTDPQFVWTVDSGPGQINGNFLLGSYASQPTDSGDVTVSITLVGDESVTDSYSFRVGDCQGLAVFYQFEGDIDFPAGNTECGATDLDENFSIKNDNDDQDGVNPELPPPEGWVANQNYSINETLANPGAVPRKNGETCVVRNFPAETKNISSLGVGPAGDTVNVDFELYAEGRCDQYPPSSPDGLPETECSDSANLSAFWARYDIEVTEPATWLVEVDLVCTENMPDIASTNNVTVSAVRLTESGVLRPTNYDFSKAFLQPELAVCDDASRAVISREVELDAPDATGTTDRVTFIITGGLYVITERNEPNGQDVKQATMVGTVRVSPLN